MNCTIETLHDHGSIVLMLGTSDGRKPSSLRRCATWDQNQFYHFARDHQDLALPFDAFYDESGEEPVFWVREED